MNALKHIGLLSFAMLTACAPPKTFVHTEDINTQDMTKPGLIEKQASEVTNTQSISALSEKIPSSWELSGAIAARNKTKAWTATVNWLQRGPSAYQIRLSGPLGSGAVLIEKQNGLIRFRDGPKSATSKNADELLQQQTGIRLPVNNLFYWVRGLPAPGPVQSSKRTPSNQLQVLHQSGFTIEYLGYTKTGNAVLPSLIKLQGNGIFIKLVIKRWKI